MEIKISPPKFSLKVRITNLSTSEGQFELDENNEVGDRGGDHAGQSTPGDLEQATPRDWLGVVDDVHHLLYVCSILECQLAVVQPKESDVLETSVKIINFKAKQF